MSDPRKPPDPLDPYGNTNPFEPPDPRPHYAPDWYPAQRPPFQPPGAPDPGNPGQNPWRQNFGGPFSQIMNHALVWSISLLIATFALSTVAFAAGAGGGGGAMPWDTPLTNIQNDLTGTTASALALIAMVAVIGVLIFGGEFGYFFRGLCYIVLCASVLVAGNNFFTAIGIAGASVGERTMLDIVLIFLSGLVIGALPTHLAHRIRERMRAHRARVDALITEPIP